MTGEIGAKCAPGLGSLRGGQFVHQPPSLSCLTLAAAPVMPTTSLPACLLVTRHQGSRPISTPLFDAHHRSVSSKAAPLRSLKSAHERFTACFDKVKAKSGRFLTSRRKASVRSREECAGEKPLVAEGEGGVKSGCLDLFAEMGRSLLARRVGSGGSRVGSGGSSVGSGGSFLTKSSSSSGSESTDFRPSYRRSALKGARGHPLKRPEVKFDDVRRVREFTRYRFKGDDLNCGPDARSPGTKLTRLCACESKYKKDGSRQRHPFEGRSWMLLSTSRIAGCGDSHCVKHRWGPRLER